MLRPGPEALERRRVLATYTWSPGGISNDWFFATGILLPDGIHYSLVTNWVSDDGAYGIPGNGLGDAAVIESGSPVINYLSSYGRAAPLTSLTVGSSATLILNGGPHTDKYPDEAVSLSVGGQIDLEGTIALADESHTGFNAALQAGDIRGSGDVTLGAGQVTTSTIGPGIRVHGVGMVSVGTNQGEIFADAGGLLSVGLDASLAADSMGRNSGHIYAKSGQLLVGGGYDQVHEIWFDWVNEGVIESLGPAADVRVGGVFRVGTFHNEGLLNNDGGRMEITDRWLNSDSGPGGTVGRITASNGGVTSLEGSFRLDPSSVVTGIGGPTSTGDGVIELNGTWDNTGRTRTFDTTTGPLKLGNEGTIIGGTIATRESVVLDGSSKGELFLVGVTLDGTLDLPEYLVVVSQGLTLTPESHILLGSDDPNLAGQAAGGIAIEDPGGIIGSDPQSPAEIRFRGGSNGINLASGQMIPLGPGILIHGKNGRIWDQEGRFNFPPPKNPSLINRATIASDEGGTITIQVSNWTNSASGLLKAANQGFLATLGTWTQAGRMVALGDPPGSARRATLFLGGTFDLLPGSSVSAPDGVVVIDGTLINDDDILDLDQSTGSWILQLGTIRNGTVRTANGIALIGTPGVPSPVGPTTNTLDGVTLEGTLDLGRVPNATATIKNNLFLSGTGKVLIGSADGTTSGSLLFNGDQELRGFGEVILGKSANNSLRPDDGNPNRAFTLTIREAITIHGENGTVGGIGTKATSGHLINRGTIIADVNRGTIRVGTAQWQNGDGAGALPGNLAATLGGTLTTQGLWVDMGRLVIPGAATINLGGECFLLSTASFMTGGIGTVNVTGLVHIGGLTLPQDNSTGSWHLKSGGKISGGDAGGVIAPADGQVLYGEGGTLEEVVYNGRLVGSLTADHLTLNGTYEAISPTQSSESLYLVSDLILHGQMVFDSAYLMVNRTASILGDGTIRMNGEIGINNEARLTIGPDIRIQGRGIIFFLNQAEAVINQGTIVQDDPQGFFVMVVDVIDGTGDESFVNQGTIEWDPSVTLDCRASLINAGRLIPGGAPGVGGMKIDHDFIQDAAGTLEIDLAQPYPGVFVNDSIQVDGSVSLDGTLDVVYHDGVLISSGQDFLIISIKAPSGISGDFATKQGIAGPGQGLATIIDQSGYHLSALNHVHILALAGVDADPRNKPVPSIDVTFGGSIDPSSFDYHDVALSLDGGPNLVTSAVTVSLLSGSTYRIGGLAGLTGADGSYTLTIDTTGISDQAGQTGTASSSISWRMDATPPTSRVATLPKRGTSLNFPVTITGADPGMASSGLASFDMYASTNGGPWTFWTSVPAANPTATFNGQSNTTYAFYSIAHDLAGNIEKKNPVIETSTYLPDVTPPATVVNGTGGASPSTVDAATSAFTLNLTGSDAGGSGLAYFSVFVAIDAQTPVPAGPAIPAGTTDGSGHYHASIAYSGLTDGVTHQYRFFSTGLDGAGNAEAVHTAPNDVVFTQAFAPPAALQMTGLTVEHGAAERSYLRYLDIAFNESDAQSGGQLGQIAASIGSGSPKIGLFRYDLNGSAASKTAVPLQAPTTVAVIDHAIELDFGAGGIGGNANATAADGYYELDVDLPNSTTAVHHFYRLLGDVTGDGAVDNLDLAAIAASLGQTTRGGMTPLTADVNGDGSVTALDATLTTRSKGRKLGSGLPLG